MLSATAIGFILYVSMLVLLCTGFTFTHMMEGFPNLAHTSFATIGTMWAYHTVRLWGLNPYLAWPSAALLNGLVGVAIYLTVVRPISARGDPRSGSPLPSSASPSSSGASSPSTPTG